MNDILKILRAAAKGSLPDEIDAQSNISVELVRELIEAELLSAIDTSTLDGGDRFLNPKITPAGREYLERNDVDPSATDHAIPTDEKTTSHLNALVRSIGPESASIAYLPDTEPNRLAQTICAMANTEGGRIYLGLVRRDGASDNGYSFDAPGVDPNDVKNVLGRLHVFFDDPLPRLSIRGMAVSGSTRPITLVTVENQGGDVPIALINLEIWRRERTKNFRFGTRLHSIRPPSTEETRSVADNIGIQESINIEVVRGGRSGPSESGPIYPQDNEATIPISRLFKLNPSRTLRRVIERAVNMLRQAGGNEPIRSSLIFFAMCEVGRDEDEPFATGFLAKRILLDNDKAYHRSLELYLALISRRGLEGPSDVDWTQFISPGLWRDCQWAHETFVRHEGPSRALRARYVLAAFLFNRKPTEEFGAPKRVRDLGLDPRRLGEDLARHMIEQGPEEDRDTWRGLLSEGQASDARTDYGGRWRIQREATPEERCLNVDKYADVLANLFVSAGDDEQFSLALFGNWGRGKTYLARLVAENLEFRGYTSVFFSAWKFRTTPEIWIHLYENIVDALKQKTWFMAIRSSFVRRGPWPAIFSVIALWGALQTVGQRITTLLSVVRFLGIAGLVYAAFVYWRMRSFAGEITRLYAALPRHREKLGLQATIGSDLRSLLIGWRQPDTNQWNRESRPPWMSQRFENCFALAVYCTCCIAVTYQLWQLVLLRTLDRYLPADMQATSAGTIIALAIAGAWAVVAVVIPWIALGRDSRNRRILLVVDDLDRCHPDQMLEIIESIVLLLDEPEIGARLQVCTLIDEVALAHALLKKYSFLTENRHKLGPSFTYSANRLVRENIEKFFLVHLRLPSLNDVEFKDVMRKFLGMDTGSASLSSSQVPLDEFSVERPNTNAEDAAAGSDASSVRTEATEVPNSETGADTSTDVNQEVELSDYEKEILLNLVQELRNSEHGATWGPRAIRSFIFRYQLARTLLTRLQVSVNPRELAQAVAIPKSAIDDDSQLPPEILVMLRIVDQVT